ncbi:hypothetical protein [Corynebacterium variabile]|uniref:hypothetical protein n=1 Tax=Corynebacterium variabile TaxID=1727 RepID=UPI003A8CB06F
MSHTPPRNILVVGCGSAGEATLMHMMEELRTQSGTGGTAPRPSFRFVSIDQPPFAEVGPTDLPSVANGGGRYVSIGTKQSYRVFDAGLSIKLGERKALGEIATWAPRAPRTVILMTAPSCHHSTEPRGGC